MASLEGPAFDPILAEALKLFPPSVGLTHESVLKQREMLAPQGTPEAVLTDPEILHEDVTVPGPGGDISLSILRSKNSAGGLRPAIYQIHGGGMILGNKFFYLNLFFPWIKEFDLVFISVEYRLAPEFPAPAQVEDCYAGLQWVGGNAEKLGIDAAKIMIAGTSAGGGLAAGVVLLSRDRMGPSVFAQLLSCPMIDDRVVSVSSKQFFDNGLWTGRSNTDAWNMMLPGTRGTEDVSFYVAPSRAEDLSSLPPTFIEVGDAEPFRDENVAYASKLWEAGVNAELHVWPGVWHGSEIMVPTAEVSKIAKETRLNWLRRIINTTTVPSLVPVV